MADGAVIATAGSTPQAALFHLATVSPGQTDIVNPGVLDAARYELHRALDRGNDADVLAWARRWGEALVDGVEDYADEAVLLRDEAAESEIWNGSLSEADANTVKEVEASIDSAAEAAADALNSLKVGAIGVPTAIAGLEEVTRHLAAASKDIATL